MGLLGKVNQVAYFCTIPCGCSYVTSAASGVVVTFAVGAGSGSDSTCDGVRKLRFCHR